MSKSFYWLPKASLAVNLGLITGTMLPGDDRVPQHEKLVFSSEKSELSKVPIRKSEVVSPTAEIFVHFLLLISGFPNSSTLLIDSNNLQTEHSVRNDH